MQSSAWQAHQSLLDQCESEIRAGRGHAAHRKLAQLNIAQIPRDLRLGFANLCRRSGLITLGIKILARIVNVGRQGPGTPPSAAELAEYAMLLNRTGASKEAISRLKQVDTKAVPEASLYLALCYFGLWRYEEAIPCLEEYASAPLSDYWRSVANVNLASAFIASERFVEALDVLSETLTLSRQAGHKRIEGNCLELRAQVYFNLSGIKGNLIKSRADLDEAAALFTSLQTDDQLYIKKWIAILETKASGQPAALEAFREEAVRRKNWESVRESDRYLLGIRFDERRFEHLLFGTPHDNYRRVVCLSLGRTLGSDVFVLGDADARAVLNLKSARMGHEIVLNPGKKSHQLLEIGLRDFYRPLRLGALFSELFPGEHFDIFSSADRVHQALRRARKEFKEAALPISIVESKGDYKLELAPGFAVEVPFERSSVAGFAAEIEQLESAFAGRAFNSAEARSVLGLPRTSVQRVLTWALSQAKLVKRGSRNSTEYEFPTAQRLTG